MAAEPKKISCDERRLLVASQEGLDRILQKMGLQTLKNEDGLEVDDFSAIVDGGIYHPGTIARPAGIHPDETRVEKVHTEM
jgi:hypothetical protein